MSGKVLGEVLAAADQLKRQGLSERGFYALIAIADKADADTRQASVRWSHIQAVLWGKSLSTAKRAVDDLKRAGMVRLVKRGFDNHQGRKCAPVYVIEQIAMSSEQVAKVTQSERGPTTHIGDPLAQGRTVHPDEPVGNGEQGTQVTQSGGGRTGHIGGRTGHPGDLLDVFTDVENSDSRSARTQRDSAETPCNFTGAQQSVNGNGNTAPGPLRCARCHQPITENRPDASGWCRRCTQPLPRSCTDHTGGFVRGCRRCGKALRESNEYDAEIAQRRQAAAAARQYAIDRCRACDPNGHYQVDDNCVADHHPIHLFIELPRSVTA